MSLSLYRKYRPQTFSDVIGQHHIVQTLSNSITSGRIGHAYLFTGPRGTGKTTLARIFARAVNCQNPKNGDPCLECETCKNISDGKSLDIFEIDAASNTGVDNIRELRENVKFPPTIAKFKVYIIDEVHMLSTGAFNALLKTLEEPPAHVIFILATTEIHKVPETIISRCQRYDFTRLNLDQIIEKLSAIAKTEKVSIEKEALEMIAIAAEGGMRDAESLLAQVISLEDKKITAKEVEEILGTTKHQALEAMAGYLLKKDAQGAITLVSELSHEGFDLDVFNKSLLNYLRQIMLASVDATLAKLFSFELTQKQTDEILELAKNRKPQDILFVVQCFSEIQGKIKSAFIPQLPLEMAIIKAMQGKQETERIATPLNAAPAAPAPKATPQIEKIDQLSAPKTSFQFKSPRTTQTQSEPKNEPVVEVEPVSEESAPLAQENAEFSLNDVKKHWNQALIEVKPLNHSLAAVLPSTQPIKVEGNVITLATRFGFHKDKLEEMKNKLTVESVFAKILGSSQVKIRVVTAQEAGITLQEPSSQSRDSREEKPSETSSLLSDAMGIMGGTVVE